MLIVYFSNSLLGLIFNSLLSPAARGVYSDKLNFWALLLYGLIYFGSFPVIMVVIKLNQSQLQKLNIDRFYILALIAAGSIILYSIPYNPLAIIALCYGVYVLLDNKVRFGTVDRSVLRLILLIAGLVGGLIMWIVGSADAGLVLEKSEQWRREFLLETIPISICQEAVYRGMLYMFLKDLGASESKALYVQALLFWIGHINHLLGSPIFFWIVLPILSLILGYIVSRSISLTASTLAHLLYNAFVAVWQLLG